MTRPELVNRLEQAFRDYQNATTPAERLIAQQELEKAREELRALAPPKPRMKHRWTRDGRSAAQGRDA